MKSIKYMLCGALVLLAYLPTFRWMVIRVFEGDSYYGHLFLIPLVSIFIVWQRRAILQKVKISSAGIGLAITIFSLLAHIVSMALKIYFVSGISFVFAIYGLVLYLFGKEMTRNLTFPIFFLFAMVPLPIVLIGSLVIKLKLAATHMSVWTLNHIGFPSIQDGSVIRMPKSYIEVAAPCSGLSSIISLLTLGLLFSYAMKISYWKKSILFISSVPIAMATNVMRITLIAVVNDLYGAKVAMGKFHDATGFAVFAVAFVMMMGVGKLLDTSHAQ